MSEERSDFLSRLAARARGEAGVLAPWVPSRWEEPEAPGLAREGPAQPDGLLEAPVGGKERVSERQRAGPETSPQPSRGRTLEPADSPTDTEAAVIPLAPDGPGDARVGVGAVRTSTREEAGPSLAARSRTRVLSNAASPRPGETGEGDGGLVRRSAEAVPADPDRGADALLLPSLQSPPRLDAVSETRPPPPLARPQAAATTPVLERHRSLLEVTLPQAGASDLPPLREVEEAVVREARRIVAAESDLTGSALPRGSAPAGTAREPVVHVHIGRVEVKPAEPPSPPPPAPPRRSPALSPSGDQGGETLSLDDYLEQRDRRWQ